MKKATAICMAILICACLCTAAYALEGDQGLEWDIVDQTATVNSEETPSATLNDDVSILNQEPMQETEDAEPEETKTPLIEQVSDIVPEVETAQAENAAPEFESSVTVPQAQSSRSLAPVIIAAALAVIVVGVVVFLVVTKSRKGRHG